MSERRILLGIHIKRILRVSREAREGRCLIGHRIVGTSVADEIGAVFHRTAPRSAKGRHAAEQTVRAVARTQCSHAAESHFTEVAGEINARFTAEQAAVVAEAAGIRIKAVFELEANLETVADVFSPLNAKARARLRAGLHFKLVNGIDAALVGVDVRILKPQVHHAVKRHIGCIYRASGHSAESTCNCERCNGFLEHGYVPSLFS